MPNAFLRDIFIFTRVCWNASAATAITNTIDTNHLQVISHGRKVNSQISLDVAVPVSWLLFCILPTFLVFSSSSHCCLPRVQKQWQYFWGRFYCENSDLHILLFSPSIGSEINSISSNQDWRFNPTLSVWWQVMGSCASQYSFKAATFSFRPFFFSVCWWKALIHIWH